MKALRNTLDEDAFAVAYETGRQLTREDAVAYALDRAERLAGRAAAARDLSGRGALASDAT